MKTVDIKAEMRAHIGRHFKTVTAAAAHWKVSRQYLSAILKGERPPTQAMLDELGYKRETIYTKVKEKE